MSTKEPSGPDLDGVVADANAAGLPYVVIGGFSVIANGFVRATRRASDLLVPDGPGTPTPRLLRFLERAEATRFCVTTSSSTQRRLQAPSISGSARRHGIVDIMRGGLPPLDYETVAKAGHRR